MNKYDFEQCLAVGKNGEKTAKETLEDYLVEYKIKDVSDIKEYQDKDIDFILVHQGTGEEIEVEVKTDNTNHKNWNMFVEDISCERLGSDGWLRKTKAKYVFYQYTQRNCSIMVPVDIIRALTQINTYKLGKAFDKFKTSVGFLVPVSDIEKELSNYKDCMCLAGIYK